MSSTACARIPTCAKDCSSAGPSPRADLLSSLSKRSKLTWRNGPRSSRISAYARTEALQLPHKLDDMVRYIKGHEAEQILTMPKAIELKICARYRQGAQHRHRFTHR